MTHTENNNEQATHKDSGLFDWNAELNALGFASGQPGVRAILKNEPEDFCVTEIMEIEPVGEGEHIWLDISKVKCNTDQVAKALARFAGVAYRDVAYSGMKDFFAETRQWFSVWRPKGPALNWNEFEMERVSINRISKHLRKIKRGIHAANHFKIVLKDVHGDLDELHERLENIAKVGVPNYFGPQRFGRNAANMAQALDMFANNRRIKNKSLRGILLSSSRSWLFNHIVSARVKDGSWNSLRENEPANLSGSNSVFTSEGSSDEGERLLLNDIHPTAPLWGERYEKAMQNSWDQHNWEDEMLAPFSEFKRGLEGARVEYQRRATRSVPRDLSWTTSQNQVSVEFELGRGQFATSVLREVVTTV